MISLGDRDFEKDALHVMGEKFSHPFIKTIKLKEKATPEELGRQLELVAQKFKNIVKQPRNLKIDLFRKPRMIFGRVTRHTCNFEQIFPQAFYQVLI